ncbi:hypothetical protein Q8A64_03880 [Oxalobacteraceae bacterium R-40]|uniref:Uncharacterized protein n=1 Tax=Keguizhuia sedimenti TaxID=3064264 RepID=A0ABU1BM92_9BURK|nr:hypothetical protein [Oxalobacteraceae bacterium R-40]
MKQNNAVKSGAVTKQVRAMHPKRQLEFIIHGKVALAVDEYLHGDWSQVQMLFTLPRHLFDAWADGVDLPYGRVLRKKSCVDGIYVLPDPEGWLVFRQECGIPLSGKRVYATYKEAKRAALALEFLEVLRGAV